MDIVLLQLPFWGVDCVPLGLPLLKSYLAQNNISCRVFDINAHAFNLRGKKYQDYWEPKYGYDFCMDRESNPIVRAVSEKIKIKCQNSIYKKLGTLREETRLRNLDIKKSIIYGK